MNYKVEAIVLKSRDIKEVDRIYTIFSREKGKLKIVGKGVRRPTAKLASGVEPLTLSEIFLIKAKWLDKLTGVIIVNQYARIKADEKKILSCNILFDILDRLANEKEPNEQVYESLRNYLTLLETGSLTELSSRLVQLGIIWKVIGWSGFQPGVFSCASCGEKLAERDIYWFNISLGLECEKCTSKNLGKKVRIAKDTVKILRIFLVKPAEVLPKIVVSQKIVSQLLQVTRMTLEEILGRRIYL